MSGQRSESASIVFTIGHSTRAIEDFIGLLKAYGIKRVVDIRTVPRSRHNPQFNRESLPDSLKAVDIDYVHMVGLGGLRHAQRDSPNMGWRNASFRGFADYMQTQEFEENLQALIKLTKEARIALMCAEAVPWRCHRSLIADALFIREVQVEHIISLDHSYSHKLTSWTKIEGTRITYPSVNFQLLHASDPRNQVH